MEQRSKANASDRMDGRILLSASASRLGRGSGSCEEGGDKVSVIWICLGATGRIGVQFWSDCPRERGIGEESGRCASQRTGLRAEWFSAGGGKSDLESCRKF